MAEFGSVHKTASGIVLASGKPIRVGGLRFQSGVGGPGTVTIYDGTSASGTQRAQMTGTANSNSTVTFGVGIKCSSGFYLDMDANVVYVDVDVLQEQST